MDADNEVGIQGGPTISELITIEAEQQRKDDVSRKHWAEMATIDWNRDFGHCFPDLMAPPTKEELAAKAKTTCNCSHAHNPKNH